MISYSQCQKNQPLCSIIIFTQSQKYLKDSEISIETRQKLLTLQQNYDHIVSKHSSDIGHTLLEGMTIDKDPNFPHDASKPYPLPLEHHKCVKEETKNLLEAGQIDRSMSPYAPPITIVPRKSKPQAPLAEID